MNLLRKRPLGVTLIALGFLWIGIGGALLFPLLILIGDGQDLWRIALEPVTHSAAGFKAISRGLDITLYLIYLAYAVIGFGLWKLKNWARKCVLVISVAGTIGALAVASIFVTPVALRICVLGMAVTEFGWMSWYLLRPRVLEAFGAWNRYTPEFEWIQPPVLSNQKRLGMGLLFASALIVLFALPLAIDVESEMAKSGAYKLTMSTAQASPCVSGTLGLPLESGWLMSGYVTESATEGSADLSIPVEGPRGRGKLDVQADKQNGGWKIESLVFKHASTRSIIVPAKSNRDCR